jgi:tetratricopeptide (TPR) repeat protein
MEAGRPDSAVVYATRAMECDPAQADSYWYLAHAQLELGEPENARRTVDRGVEAAPRSQRLSLFRARLCLDSGDVATAREIVEKILILPMNRGEALYLRGQIELVEGDSVAAMASWREALEETLGEEARR